MNSGKTIGVLIFIVVVLAGVVVYTLGIKPVLSGYVVDAQNQGVEFAVLSIMQQAATCQTVPLTFGNQTINMIAVECLQQTQNQQVELPVQ